MAAERASPEALASASRLAAPLLSRRRTVHRAPLRFVAGVAHGAGVEGIAIVGCVARQVPVEDADMVGRDAERLIGGGDVARGAFAAMIFGLPAVHRRCARPRQPG